MSAESTSYQRLRERLAYLKLSTAAEQLPGELDRALKEQLSATEVLESLLGAEVAQTRARRERSRLRFARYPVIKTLAEFDFDFQPHLDRKLIAELSTLRFVEERRNVILLGPPGVGKTHLAIALGVAVSGAGFQTYFTTAAEMVHVSSPPTWSATPSTRSAPSCGRPSCSSTSLGICPWTRPRPTGSSRSSAAATSGRAPSS